MTVSTKAPKLAQTYMQIDTIFLLSYKKTRKVEKTQNKERILVWKI